MAMVSVLFFHFFFFFVFALGLSGIRIFDHSMAEYYLLQHFGSTYQETDRRNKKKKRTLCGGVGVEGGWGGGDFVGDDDRADGCRH